VPGRRTLADVDLQRLRDWIAAAPQSFERGEVHEENLRYLLADAFAPDRAWEQTVLCFQHVVGAAGKFPERLIVRAVIPLSDAAEMELGPIDPARIPSELNGTTPPMLVLMPPRLAVDHRRFEEYRVALATDLDAAVTYSVARSLDIPDDGSWTRSIVLERF